MIKVADLLLLATMIVIVTVVCGTILYAAVMNQRRPPRVPRQRVDDRDDPPRPPWGTP